MIFHDKKDCSKTRLVAFAKFSGGNIAQHLHFLAHEGFKINYSQRQILVLHNSVQSNPLWTLTKFVSFIFLSTPIRLVLFVFEFVFLALAGALEIGYRK